MMYSKNQFVGMLVVFLTLHCPLALANIELLNIPAKNSHLATSSIVTALDNNNGQLTAVGERGHIFSWQSADQWQQQEAPVSVLLTGIVTLADQSQVAVGQDGAILVRKVQQAWQKVFDGYQLTELKMALLEKQIAQLETLMASTEDEDELEEFEYQLDELTFSLEDAQAEHESGPNKPLLSVAQAANGSVFIVGAYGTLLRSDDGGHTWQLQDDLLENPDKLHLNAIQNINDKLFIVGESGQAFVSYDNGDSWQFIALPYSGSIFGISGQSGTDNLVAYGLQGNLMTSADAGQSWQAHSLATSASILGGTVSTAGDAYLVGHGGLVVHFNFSDVKQLNVQKHPSGAAFAAVTVNHATQQAHQLILAGQFGLTAWQLP